MKKLILFLIMASIASLQVFAQTPDDPPTCTGSASEPAVGVLYTYEVEVPAVNGYTGTGTFDWYVMDQGDLDLLNGTHIANGSGEFIASGHYDAPTGSADTIEITWSSLALASGQPYFLVVVYEEAAVCPNNNIKLYRIMPQNTFWLAMDNVTTIQCAASISSAEILDIGSPTNPNGLVEYIYGENTLVVEVTASGYTGDWDAELQLGGFVADQSVEVTWAAASGPTGTFTSANANGVYTSATQLPSLVSGEVITITIVVDNNHFENLSGQTIDIAIDGSYTANGVTFEDLSDVNGQCTPESAFADAEVQSISARPTVNPVTPVDFVPQVTP
jgi:hypothetical protein